MTTTKKKRARPAVVVIAARWRWESTPNHHIGKLGRLAIVVDRNRSWRRLGFSDPWRVRLFGNHFPGLPNFADLDDAKRAAEHEAEKWIAEVAMQIGGAR